MSDHFFELVDRTRAGDSVTASECAAAARAHRLEAWDGIRERHRHGASGESVVHQLTDAADAIVAGAAEAAAATAGPRDALFQRVAVCALGGYGRRELSPESDLDVCLLYEGELDDAVRAMNDYLVPFFWDAGFDSGYVLQEPDGLAELCGNDLSVLTANLLSRCVWGNPSILAGLKARIAAPEATSPEWVQACAQRGYRRHLPRDFSERFAREPNLKEQAGGLRDYHAAVWLYALKYGPVPLEALVSRGIIETSQMMELREGLDFLWRLRNELHWSHGRRVDVLTLGNQELAARAFDYGPEPDRAIERFMQDYFSATQGVRDFLRHAVADCAGDAADPEEERAAAEPQLRHHRSYVCAGMHDKRWFAEYPTRLMQVFWESARSGKPVSRATLRRVSANLDLVNDDFREDDLVRRFFVGICGRPLAAGGVFRQMHEAGLLGAYLPEFQAISGIIRYEAFHSYPVDEHTLRAIESLGEIYDLEGKVGAFIARTLEHVREPAELVLAILFHDLGKVSGEEHVEEGVAIVRLAGKRMGLASDLIERVAFLVEHHMVMTDVAMYRDTDDPAVVATFAEAMRSDDRLRELLVLSHCDLKAVAPGVWTDWKGALLMKLHLKTERLLSGRDLGADDTYWLLPRIADVAEALKADDTAITESDVARHLEGFGERYVMAFRPAEIATHMLSLRALGDEAADVRHNVHAETGLSEVTIITRDRPGLFATLAGAFTANEAAVQSAGLFTNADGYVIDFFQVRHTREPRSLTRAQMESVASVIQRVLEKGEPIQNFVDASRSRLFAMLQPAAPVAAGVTFDDQASPKDTVVDIIAGDRTGLLYDIAAVFAALSINVLSARINTDDFRVRDAFHLLKDGSKIEDEGLRHQLREQLAGVLEPLVAQNT